MAESENIVHHLQNIQRVVMDLSTHVASLDKRLQSIETTTTHDGDTMQPHGDGEPLALRSPTNSGNPHSPPPFQAFSEDARPTTGDSSLATKPASVRLRGTVKSMRRRAAQNGRTRRLSAAIQQPPLDGQGGQPPTAHFQQSDEVDLAMDGSVSYHNNPVGSGGGPDLDPVGPVTPAPNPLDATSTADNDGSSPKANVNKRRAAGGFSHLVKTGSETLGCFGTIQSLDSESVIVNVLDAFYIVITLAYCVIISTFFSPAQNDLIDIIAVPAVVVAVFQILTIAWVFVQFYVRRLRSDWEVIDTPSELRTAYLKSWFIYDLIYTIPIEFIFLGWANDVFFYVMCRQVLRLFRIFVSARSQNPLLESRQWMHLVFFCGVCLLVAHVGANVFWLTEGDNPEVFGTNPKYIDAIYWSAATLTSTGYGDISAKTPVMRLLSVVFMLCGILLISGATALFTSLLTAKDALHEEQDRKRKMLHSMFKHFSIPWHIQKEVIALFPSVLDSQSEVVFKEMIRSLPPFLANKVDDYLRAKMLKGVPLFSGMADDEVVLALSRKLQQRFVAPFDYVIEAGMIGKEMYFLVHGVVEILIPNFFTETVTRTGIDGRQIEVEEEVEEEKPVATLRSGSYFGEIALLQDTKRTASVQALTACEILVLEKDDLNAVVQRDDAAELRERLQREIKDRQRQIEGEKANKDPKNVTMSKVNPAALPPPSLNGTMRSALKEEQPNEKAKKVQIALQDLEQSDE